jgi:hypothetical protein
MGDAAWWTPKKWTAAAYERVGACSLLLIY